MSPSTYTVTSIYCPHGNPDKSLIINICDSNDKQIIMGDFNSKHTNFGCSKTDKFGISLLNIINSNKLSITKSGEPTYYNEVHNNYEIDLILISTSLKHSLTSSYIGKDISSDHFPVITQLGQSNKINL